MKWGLSQPKLPNADGRKWKRGDDGVTHGGMFAGGDNQKPVKSAVDCERYITLAPGETRTVCTSIYSALRNSMYMWPLGHASAT